MSDVVSMGMRAERAARQEPRGHGLVAVAVGALLLTACAPAQQRGIDSSRDAVTHLLGAVAQNDADAARALFTRNITDALLERNMEEIQTLISRAGGAENLTVVEKDHTGPAYLMEVYGPDSVFLSSLTVSEEPGGLFVIPSGAEAIVEGPTSAPE